MPFLRSFFLAALVCFFTFPAFAQDTAVPEMPEPLKNLAAQGAQVRFLGKAHDLDGWVAIFKGQEQYFYVLPDGQAFMMGLLFDQTGKLVTVEQVRDLQAQGGDVLDQFATDLQPTTEQPQPQLPDSVAEAVKQYQNEPDRLFEQVEGSNWIPLGNPNAPVIYSFVDPQCPHCHEFMADLKKDYIDAGRLQVRIVPVGFQAESLAQAAFLLASPDAAERWYRHLAGDETALPAKSTINTQGVERNMALMQEWKFDVTPFTVYRSAGGDVKLVRGRAKDMGTIMSDLGS